MTEQEWNASSDPAAMLEHLHTWDTNDPRWTREQWYPPGDRKLRLFACACARACWALLRDDAPCGRCGASPAGPGRLRPDPEDDSFPCPDCAGAGRVNRSRRAVCVAESFADGLATEEELAAAYEAAGDAHDDASDDERSSPFYDAWACCDEGASEAVRMVLNEPLSSSRTVMADLLRDILGNPFRAPAFNPSWRTPAALAIASTIYADRDFPACPVLADALEDAGCDDDEILFHLRGLVGCPKCEGAGGYTPDGPAVQWQRCTLCKGQGLLPPPPHARGCWVLDLILERN